MIEGRSIHSGWWKVGARTRNALSDENHPLKSVLTVIVNYRVGDLVVGCLRSLESQVHANAGGRVVVVDNDSGDGSVDAIQRAIDRDCWGGWARLVCVPGNIGFAAGNNLGYKAGREWLAEQRPDYVFFLNPDTYLRDGAIGILTDFLDTHPEVGIAGGRSEDPDATPQHCSFRFPSVFNEFAANAKIGVVDRLLRGKIARMPILGVPHRVGWLSGAAMMIRTELFETLGQFDENYFLYYEETDLILRAHRAGWTCWHVPQSRIVHLVGYSSGVTLRHRRPGRKPKYWFDSRRRYFLKNHGVLYAASADLAAIVGSTLGALRGVVSRREKTDPPRFIRDLIRNSVFLKGASTA